jgi:hypothetical protein
MLLTMALASTMILGSESYRAHDHVVLPEGSGTLYLLYPVPSTMSLHFEATLTFDSASPIGSDFLCLHQNQRHFMIAGKETTCLDAGHPSRTKDHTFTTVRQSRGGLAVLWLPP